MAAADVADEPEPITVNGHPAVPLPGLPPEPPAKAVEAPVDDAARADQTDALDAAIVESGQTRVIVTLRSDWRPEGNLNAAGVAAQRATIGQERAALVRELRGVAFRLTHEYESLPLVAGEVDGAALDALRRSPRVAHIAPDELLAPSLADSVPLIGAGPDANLTYDGTGTTVAVLDTGVDKGHAFLSGKVVEEACYSAAGHCPGGVTASTASGSGAPCTGATSGCRHGTYVAGVVAGNNSQFTGVAPGAKIMAIRVFSIFSGASNCAGAGEDPCTLAYTSDTIKGLERVAARRTAHNIVAANLSLGGGHFASASACDGANPGYKAIIDQLRSVNVATVAASGNDGFTAGLGSPSCVSSAISVGSSTKADGISTFSNSANYLDLLAPGQQINTSSPRTSAGAPSPYASVNGTSFATPHVAGAWALLRQASPGRSVTNVLADLKSTGRNITDNRNGITKPRIDVRAALGNRPAGLCPPDDVWEPNQTSGFILKPGETIDGIVCDDDWFAIWAQSGDRIKVDLRFTHASGDLDVQVTKPDMDTDLGSSTSVTDNEALTTPATDTTGYHFVRVYGHPSSATTHNDYRLTLDALRPNNTRRCSDRFEPNNTFNDATGLAPGLNPNPAPTQLSVLCPNDLDWFWFSAGSGQTIAYDVLFNQARGDLDAFLLDDAIYNSTPGSVADKLDASIVAFSISETHHEFIRYVSNKNGDFTLVVSGFQGASNVFTLAYGLFSGCKDDPFEANPELALTLRGDRQEWVSAILCKGDLDWYAVNLPDGVLVAGDLLFRHSGNDLDLYLFDPGGNVVAAGESSTNNESIEYRTTSAGTYFFAVRDFQATKPGNSYLFLLTPLSANAPRYDMFSDAEDLGSARGGNISGMTNIGATKESGEPKHAGNGRGQSIWFTWKAPVTGPVTFDTRGANQGAPSPNAGPTTFDTVLAAYQGTAVSGLDELKSNTNDGGSPFSAVTFTATRGRTYRVAVDGEGSTPTGELNLNWSQTQAIAAAPRNLRVEPGNQGLVVSWDPQRNDGRQRVERYRISTEPADAAATTLSAGGVPVGPDGRHFYVVQNLTEGRAYRVSVQALSAGTTGSQATATSDAVAPGPVTATRAAGLDRYATAADLSAKSFGPGVGVVYVATGLNFPDALAGVPAAARDRGPILLVRQDEIPEATQTELRRLEPGRIVILGGEAVVSAGVAGQLAGYTAGEVERLSGADRYETAAEIAKTFPADVPVAYVATGLNFPDALAGGAAAAVRGAPVLLVKPDEIPGPIATQLQRLSPDEIVVLGGDTVVSSALQSALGAHAPTVRRVAGKDRYATATQVAQDSFGGYVHTAYVATGENFPDALAAGPVGGLFRSPVILVRTAPPLPATVSETLNALVPQRIVVLGSDAAVQEAVVNLVRDAA